MQGAGISPEAVSRKGQKKGIKRIASEIDGLWLDEEMGLAERDGWL